MSIETFQTIAILSNENNCRSETSNEFFSSTIRQKIESVNGNLFLSLNCFKFSHTFPNVPNDCFLPIRSMFRIPYEAKKQYAYLDSESTSTSIRFQSILEESPILFYNNELNFASYMKNLPSSFIDKNMSINFSEYKIAKGYYIPTDFEIPFNSTIFTYGNTHLLSHSTFLNHSKPFSNENGNSLNIQFKNFELWSYNWMENIAVIFQDTLFVQHNHLELKPDDVGEGIPELTQRMHPILEFNRQTQKINIGCPILNYGISQYIDNQWKFPYFQYFNNILDIKSAAGNLFSTQLGIPVGYVIYVTEKNKYLLHLLGLIRLNQSNLQNKILPLDAFDALFSFSEVPIGKIELPFQTANWKFVKFSDTHILCTEGFSDPEKSFAIACNKSPGLFIQTILTEFASKYSDNSVQSFFDRSTTVAFPYPPDVDLYKDILIKVMQCREGALDSATGLLASNMLANVPIMSAYGSKQVYIPLEKNWIPINGQFLNQLDIQITSSTTGLNFEGIPWDLTLNIGCVIPSQSQNLVPGVSQYHLQSAYQSQDGSNKRARR